MLAKSVVLLFVHLHEPSIDSGFTLMGIFVLISRSYPTALSNCAISIILPRFGSDFSFSRFIKLGIQPVILFSQ